MSGRIVPIDVLFARVRLHGAPFESLAEDEDERREADSPVTDARLPTDAALTEWEPFGYDDSTAGVAPREEEDSTDDGDDNDADFAPDELERSERDVIRPLPETELSFAQHQVYGEARAYGAALVRHIQFIRQTADRIAGGDPHLEGDLAQEALIELWELDPSRFDEGDQLYLKQALVARMIDAAERDFVQGTGVPRARLRAYLKARKNGDVV